MSCAAASCGSAPSARPPHSNRLRFPSDAPAGLRVAGADPRPVAALLLPSPSASAPVLFPAASCRHLAATSRRCQPTAGSSGCWGFVRSRSGGTAARRVAVQSGIVSSSASLLFLGRKTPVGLLCRRLRVATFYELAGNLLAGARVV